MHRQSWVHALVPAQLALLLNLPSLPKEQTWFPLCPWSKYHSVSLKMFRIHTEPEGKYGVWRKQYTLILGAALQKRAPPSPQQAPTCKLTCSQHIFIFIAWNNKLNQLNYSPYGRSWCARLQATNKKQNIMLDSYLSMVDTLQCNWCISLTKRCCAGSHRITCMSLDFL